MLVEKAARKGRTQAEVDEIIGWLTGYSVPQIEAAVQNGTLYGDFFRDAPQLNPDRVLKQMRKSSLLYTDRECGIILEKTLYGKDKHDERSGYYETPCRLRKRL